MEIFIYNQLNSDSVKAQFTRVTTMLAKGDFHGADVKKMQNTGFYRAKLNDADRLLFKIGEYHGEKVILLLEVILHHAYEHSRFLRGKQIDETQFTPFVNLDRLTNDEVESLVYINTKQPNFHVLDRIISFDDHQIEAFSQHLPLMLIGSAGSGKTVLLMEKLKQVKGDVLYVTRSPYLSDHARRLYYALGYTNDHQHITFAAFHELLEMIRIPEGRPVHYKAFAAWYARHRRNYPFRNAHMLFEEFGGVLTGFSVDKPFLSREEYLGLGVRRSIFEQTERSRVYDLFEKYIATLRENGFYDPSILAWEYRALCEPAYDIIAIDEIQDLTNAQIALLLMTLRHESNFILCGDSNQIVHPNFFSWTNLKTMFYQRKAGHSTEVVRILNQNYRNAPAVVDIANQLLRIKIARFGSIDRESNYLVRCVSARPGDVALIHDSASVNRELDEKTHRSARFAVLVLRDEDKPAARNYFHTPLIFSIQEAKGLEYENIILYNFVSGCRKEFDEIVQGVTPDDLQGDPDYARAKEKTDKSLEIYKFFTNALYVGLTRAIARVFWVESDTRHRLFHLLKLTERLQDDNLASETSTDEEWREEASRLEKKGNLEQAEQIRKQVLKQQPVPWTVWTPENLPELEKQALDPNSFNKKAKQQLYEYALLYHQWSLLAQLADLKFSRAINEQDPAPVERDYARDCFSKEFKELRQKVRTYGVDYRNPLNKTPLMTAISVSRLDIAEWLIQEGALVEATDNAGLSVFWQLHTRSSTVSQCLMTHDIHTPVYERLAPDCINIQFEQRLIRLEKHQFDYWMLVAFIVLMDRNATRPLKGKWVWNRIDDIHFMTSDTLAAICAQFPRTVMPAFRTKRTYCSASLSRNEAYGKALYNRKISFRVGYGLYVINPSLQLQINEKWIPIYDLLDSEFTVYLRQIHKDLHNGRVPKPKKSPQSTSKKKKSQSTLKPLKSEQHNASPVPESPSTPEEQTD